MLQCNIYFCNAAKVLKSEIFTQWTAARIHSMQVIGHISRANGHWLDAAQSGGLLVSRHNGKSNGGQPGAGTRETLARIARLISVGDEDGLTGSTGLDGAETPRLSARQDALSLASLREPGASRLLESLPAGLAVCEGASLIKANTAFALAFGYRSAEQLEEAGGLKAVFPGELKALAKLVAKSASAPQKPMELQAHSRSGREFRIPVAVHAMAAEEEDEDEKACLLVLRPHVGGHSVSETAKPGRKQASQSATSAGTAGFRKKKRKKGRKNRTETSKPEAPSLIDKTDFLAKVNHEVRTPLNSIIGFAEIMKEEQLGPIGNDRYRGYIRDIYDSGVYALSLINDLLDLSKIESGEFELNFTAVDLEEVVNESVQSMQPQAQRQRVLLRTSFSDDLPPVLADRRSIKQIVLNLVSNAIKFTKPGGQVIVSTQSTASGGVRMRVRDTGIGMSKSEIEVALKPFQQVDTSPRTQDGTGLGLPLTKALVEANRARFKLRSVSESGTRIDVTFPKSRVASGAD